MTGMITTVVHIFFLGFFFVLYFLFLKSKLRNREMREFIKNGKVYVDWPLRYLSRFCSVFSIEFSGSGALTALAPKKLHRDILFELLLLYGLEAIEYLVDREGEVFLKIFLLKKSPNVEQLQRDLSSELNMTVTIF